MGRQALEPGDLLQLSCDARGCSVPHDSVVKSVEGANVELISLKVPQLSGSFTLSGRRYLGNDNIRLRIDKLEKGAGKEVLERHLVFEALIAEVVQYRLEDSKMRQAFKAQHDKIDNLIGLVFNDRIEGPEQLAYGICRIGGLEPTDELVVLLASALSSTLFQDSSVQLSIVPGGDLPPYMRN